MADETEQPKRRKRRTRKAEPDETPDVGSTSSADDTPEVGSTSAADDAKAAEADPSSEVEPSPEDIEAEEAAADVVLEAEAEAEGDSEGEEAPPSVEFESAPEPAKPARRRRRAAAEPEAEEGEAPSKPAPRRRRRGEPDPALPPPVVRAQAKYVRSSARKARLVCDHIRGKSVEEARAILALTPRAIARDWSKLLESAVANAEHNHELVGEDLYVKAISADEGPTIKRFRPRAMGRATRIRKRTSHLTILLTPKE
jgi:ribosomal protein L22